MSGRPCEAGAQIGLCYDAKVRWEHYCDADDDAWKPTFLVLVERPGSREAAGFLETALIGYATSHAYFQQNSVNLRRRDVGGSGPRPEQRANLPHYVYIAIKILERANPDTNHTGAVGV